MNEEQLKRCAEAFDYEYGDGAWADINKMHDRLIFGTGWMHAISGENDDITTKCPMCGERFMVLADGSIDGFIGA